MKRADDALKIVQRQQKAAHRADVANARLAIDICQVGEIFADPAVAAGGFAELARKRPTERLISEWRAHGRDILARYGARDVVSGEAAT